MTPMQYLVLHLIMLVPYPDLVWTVFFRWQTSGSLYLLLHLSLGSNCLIYLSGFFSISLFLSHFFLLFIHFSLFILILAFSFILSRLLFISLSLSICLGKVNYCRKFSVRLIWLCFNGFDGRGVAAEISIISRFLLMTPSLLLIYWGSFWWL